MDKVRNPITGRLITVGGKVYNDLIKRGVSLDEVGEEKIPNKKPVGKKTVGKTGKYKTERFPFEVAKEIADELKEFFSQWGRVTVVGSVRRLDKTIGDIDFVIVPKDKKLKVIELIRALPEEKVEHQIGFRHMTITKYKDKGIIIPINIWLTTEESEGAAIMAYTGPKGCSIFYRKLANQKGYLLNEKGLFKGDEIIAGKTEEEIYRTLGRECKPPHLRGK